MLLCMHVELARLLGVNKSQTFTANMLIGKELKAFTSQIHVTIYLQSQIFSDTLQSTDVFIHFQLGMIIGSLDNMEEGKWMHQVTLKEQHNLQENLS